MNLFADFAHERLILEEEKSETRIRGRAKNGGKRLRMKCNVCATLSRAHGCFECCKQHGWPRGACTTTATYRALLRIRMKSIQMGFVTFSAWFLHSAVHFLFSSFWSNFTLFSLHFPPHIWFFNNMSLVLDVFLKLLRQLHSKQFMWSKTKKRIGPIHPNKSTNDSHRPRQVFTIMHVHFRLMFVYFSTFWSQSWNIENREILTSQSTNIMHFTGLKRWAYIMWTWNTLICVFESKSLVMRWPGLYLLSIDLTTSVCVYMILIAHANRSNQDLIIHSGWEWNGRKGKCD